MDTKMKIADAPEQMDKSEDKKGYIKRIIHGGLF